MRKPRQHREGVVTCPSLGRRGAGQESKRCTQWTCLVRARSLSLSLSSHLPLRGPHPAPALSPCLLRKPGQEAAATWGGSKLGSLPLGAGC